MDNKIVNDIFKRVELEVHTSPEFIKSYKDYKVRKINLKALRLLVHGLERNAKHILKDYCRGITKGTEDFTKLLAYRSILKAIAFYKKEIDIILDMIYEYDAYLMDGNYLTSVLGEIRPISELWDRRDMDNGF